MLRFKVLIIPFLLCVVAILLIKARSSIPQRLSVSFICMTNIPSSNIIGGTSADFPKWNLDTMGVTRLDASAKLALFAVSNSCSRPLGFAYAGAEVQRASGWAPPGGGGRWSGAFGNLMPGQTMIFPVPEADSELPWRIRLKFRLTQTKMRSLLNGLAYKLTNRTLFPVGLEDAQGPIVEKGFSSKIVLQTRTSNPQKEAVGARCF